ncbi:MAG TPA: RDD family protein, partial [Spongiibacteraceae bacterium]|nr:RDD family protein [Spongiibacteraceae bacterium]
TLGMQAWRLRVDAVQGGRPTWRQCLVRAAIGFVSLLSGGLGYWWIWIDKRRVSWHDRASNTRVVVLPKQKKS